LKSIKPENEQYAMHEVTVFPLGNADSTRIDLDGGEKILVDYADMHDPDDDTDKRIDLPQKLREDLTEDNRQSYDVVAFTHLDRDHVFGAADFFHLRHAEKYQGGDRVEIRTLWVPAAAILEENLNGDARVIRQEARYRLREGEGIRVFSSPGRLDEWLEDRDIDPEDRRHCFVNAGECVPDFDFGSNGFEVFVHTPHANRSNDGEDLSRNNDSLAFQATFLKGGKMTKMHFFSDLKYDMIEDIVRITRYYDQEKGRRDHLEWDLFHLAHHSSYTALADEKGEDQTEPTGRIRNLFEKDSNYRARMVSTSEPIPDEDTETRPHRQAANYYESVADQLNGEYLVTMEHPNEANPKPMVFQIDDNGATLVKDTGPGTDTITESSSPRAGWS
jgi:hypothetical protein